MSRSLGIFLLIFSMTACFDSGFESASSRDNDGINNPSETEDPSNGAPENPMEEPDTEEPETEGPDTEEPEEETEDPEEPGPPATKQDYSFLGNESFSRMDLDNSLKDANGITLRGWYDLLLKGGTSGEMDGAFGKAENRPANRSGFTYITSLLIGLRLVGDLKLLDESIRLTERWYAKLTPDRDINNYLHHADPTYDQTLDVTLAAGVWSRVMYAAYVNRNLRSPKGYNYGAIAQKYKTYLTDHFFPRWVIKKSTVKSALDWRASLFRHSQPGILAAQYYIGKMGGGGGHTAAQWQAAAKNSFDRFFSADKVCDAGKGGRETLVFPFNTLETTSNPDGAALIYTTYLRYVISQMMDFFLEKADPRVNDLWFKRLSHSLADLVLYPDSKETLMIARTIAGDSPSSNERCGVPYEHDYRAPMSTVDNRWQDSGFAFLEGWESTGVLIDFGKSMYAEAPVSFRESYPNYPAARMFSYIYHGRR